MQAITRGLATTVVVVLAMTGVAAQDDWLPEDVAMALSIQLVNRLESIEGRPSLDRAGRQSTARSRIERLRLAIDTSGPQTLVDRAPVPPPGLTLPTTNDTRLKAMLRYHVCNIVSMHQLQQGTSKDTRVFGAVGLTALTMVQARLLAPYLADGGRVATVEEVMTGAGMARALDALQGDAALFARAQAGCLPVVTDLIPAGE